jgi:NAD(P)-dependent dehydrogenase (short-subunit alcohol dehydrogenase family)
LKKLEGKVAIITGGSTGIGLATAHLFASEGAYVYITGRRQKELDTAVRLIGKNVAGVQGNVANLADLDRLYATVKQQHDHIDILFANAGEGRYVPFGASTEADFDSMFNINVKGTFFTVQKALPLLQDGGSIILTASIGASKGQGGGTINGASKAAVRSFARTWTVELSDRKIRVNAVSPGPINTPMLHSMGETEEQTKQILARIVTTVPMRRLGDPDEVAKAILFLASDDSSFVTGIELFVDGGVAQI